MKCIVLAKMSKRILGAVIDFVATLLVAVALFFAVILPTSLNKDEYIKNQNMMFEILMESGMYTQVVENNTTNYVVTFELLTSELSSSKDERAIDFVNDYKFKDKHYYTIDAIVRFFSEEHYLGDQKLFDIYNPSVEGVFNEILLQGQEESNIKEVYLDTDGKYKITLIDKEKSHVTFDFIADLILLNENNKKTSIIETVVGDKTYKHYDELNKSMMLNSILMILPALFGSSFIFYFIIPICSKNGETIGKYCTNTCVLSADGYTLKKIYYIPRYLSLAIIEMGLGIASFGGIFLVTYIMFCFTKKRRSIHDFLGNSVVVDKKESTWFENRDQEYRYNYKTRI